jgi:hypothetical protein
LEQAMRCGWIFAIGFVVLSAIAAAPARAEGPPPDFKRLDERGDTFKSPDKSLVIEQYTKDLGGFEGFTYQFWVFDNNRKHAFFLNREEDKNLAGYPAGFRFSPNSQWLVRMQGTGAGFQTLLLYKRDGNRFVAATAKPLGDLAWDYFFTQPVSKDMPTELDELNHKRADLLKGMEENYAWLGVKWPDSRYIVISLGFDIQGNEKPTPYIQGWRCVYDTQTGQFSVPASFAEQSAQARKLPKPKAARG